MTELSKIEELIQEELTNMCINHNQERFSSPHEAYAVTLEEVEESSEELTNVELRMKNIWLSVKEDEGVSSNYNYTKGNAMRVIQELIQVCACCDKALRGFEK